MNSPATISSRNLGPFCVDTSSLTQGATESSDWGVPGVGGVSWPVLLLFRSLIVGDFESMRVVKEISLRGDEKNRFRVHSDRGLGRVLCPRKQTFRLDDWVLYHGIVWTKANFDAE